MATNKRRIVRSQKDESVGSLALSIMSDGLFPEPEKVDRWQMIVNPGLGYPTCNYEQCLALWNEHKGEILPAWIKKHPGTRPSWWWLFSAPRITPKTAAFLGRASYIGSSPDEFCEPRRRLGGIGTPKHEVLNYAPSFDCGIPNDWVDLWQAEYYNGRRLDIHGNRIGTEYHEGDFKGAPIDPHDPPQYESQASYLKRHGLFEAGEEKRLRPRDFKPEIVEASEEDAEESEVNSGIQWPANSGQIQ
jgi:hypothetical protein